MFRIMQHSLWWFNTLGVLGQHRPDQPSSESALTIGKRTLICLVLVVNPYPQMVYLLANLDNIIETAFSIYFVVVGMGMFARLLVLYLRRVEVAALIARTEGLVNEKIQQNQLTHFATARNRLNRLLNIFGVIVLISYIIYVTSPLFIILLAYMRHNVHAELFVAPLRDLYYFFEATTSPLFEICYAFNAAKVGLVVMAYVCVDNFVVEIAMYLLALYEELKSMVDEIPKVSAMERPPKLRQCILFHLEIVELINQTQFIINNVLAAQLIYSVVTLATNTFTALYIELIEYPKMISSCACFALELFLFCWLGSKVLDENTRLKEKLYGLPWYNYREREKKILHIMMQFTSTQMLGFSAHQYIFFNIETFGMLMAKVYSALAFLQNFI